MLPLCDVHHPVTWYNRNITGIVQKVKQTDWTMCCPTLWWAASVSRCTDFLTEDIPGWRTSQELFRPVGVLGFSVPAPPAWKPRLQVLDHSWAPTFGDGCSGWTESVSAGLPHILNEKTADEGRLKIINNRATFSVPVQVWWLIVSSHEDKQELKAESRAGPSPMAEGPRSPIKLLALIKYY